MAQPIQRKDRRAHQRCPSLNYEAEVQPVSGWQRISKPFEANLIDFHRYGACLCAAKKVSVGMKLRLTIRSSSEEVRDIHAVVCYVRNLPSGYWFGVQFVASAKSKRVEQSVLVGLENMIKEQLS